MCTGNSHDPVLYTVFNKCTCLGSTERGQPWKIDKRLWGGHWIVEGCISCWTWAKRTKAGSDWELLEALNNKQRKDITGVAVTHWKKKNKLNLKKIDREFFLDCHCISPDSVQDSQHWHKINQMNMYFENITNTTLIQWWQRLQCNVPTAHQEQFGVPYVAQGHFYMQLGGARIRTSNLPITRQPTLPPKLQLPQSYHLKEYLVI